VQGPIADAVELSTKLATSEQVRECFADRWLGRSLGVAGDQLDDCTRDAVRARFVATGDVRELLVTIALSDAFRFLNTAEDE
ncbi:MAG TPA: DUF1585 domain-containing protein, partial [Nannocystaceae bacterium]|nr:DUF1585 domain-containing protein [Nannocystaceae bacterium]